jgi:hypothetical protein
LAEVFDMICHASHREGRLDPLITRPVVVEVDESGCLETGVVISGEFDWGVIGWEVGDSKCLEK